MKDFDYINIEKIIKSKRKSVAIEVTDKGTLIIKAPNFLKNDELIKILESHKNWIKKRVDIAKQTRQFTYKRFINGEKFLYLGKLYELQLVDKQKQPLIFDQKFFLRKTNRNEAEKIFIDWYKKQAKANFTRRANIYAPLLGVTYNQLKLSSARRRWGSCSNRGNINIVWRLIMAPQAIIDYVIVHELAHLQYMNHSAAFWRLVGSVYPRYKEARNWLKEYGQYLDIHKS